MGDCNEKTGRSEAEGVLKSECYDIIHIKLSKNKLYYEAVLAILGKMWWEIGY